MPWDNSPAARARSNRVYGAAWRRARAAQLQRQPNCELRYDGCHGRADQVDHILGAGADPGHQALRSVCGPCHRKRTASEQGLGYRKPAADRITDPAARPTTTW